MNEGIIVEVACSAKDTFVSAWAKHVSKVDLGKPGGFALGGDFIGGYKSTIDPKALFHITRMPDSLNNGEAVVIGATVHHKDNGTIYGKIAFVMTTKGQHKINANPFAPAVDKINSRTASAKINLDHMGAIVEMEISGVSSKFLSVYYHGDVFFMTSREQYAPGMSTTPQKHVLATSDSPFNHVAEVLAHKYKVPEADLTSDFEKSKTRHAYTRNPLNTSDVSQWQGDPTKRAIVRRKHIRHNGAKLTLPPGYMAILEPRKGLALLKRKSDDEVAFFDVLADDDEFNSNEHWEDYLEQQARALESMAMAYRIIAQMKAKKKGED